MTTAATVRSHLVEALEADLVGPFLRKPGERESDAAELLRSAPSRHYLTGFLVPREQGEIEEEPDDDDAGVGDDEDDDADGRAENSVKKVRRLPASMGLSVFVQASVKTLTATVSWADYLRVEAGEGKRWSRRFMQRTVPVTLTQAALTDGVPVDGSDGLMIRGRVEKVGDLKSVAIFLVNERQPVTGASARDEAYAFQCRLVLESPQPFHGRTDRSDETSKDPDERVNDLQHRHQQEFAVGHGVGVRVESATRIETTWLPTATVKPVVARKLDGVEVGMDALAAIESPAAARVALAPLMTAYRAWLDEQAKIETGSALRDEVRDGLVDKARRAAERMEDGLAVLEKDAQAFQAFRWMNTVMAQAEKKARQGSVPSWRLFQLAFILLNLPSVERETHEDRELVELIFFPTGGGKTQAYLGLIAFTLLLRRLRGTPRPDGGLGVAVLLRYTLRLLTLDQLGRASTLICALELLRQKNVAQLGDVRFSIGLWVGSSATANTLEQVAEQITEYRNSPSPNAQSPFPLAKCPWCGTDFVRDSFVMLPSKTKPEEVKVGCASLKCPFNMGINRDGVPVLFVDEAIYRELPCFLVATVDKFALLPWRGETGMLFGRAQGRTGGKFVGPTDDERTRKAAKVRLPNGLKPPELIVQDELHLISGPLGSMVGLYEAAVLTLAPKAKLIASTATVRRSNEQVERLYGRRVALFPPPGVEANETFFAHVGTEGARQYIGVGAPGRPLKTTLLQVYVALLAAAQRGLADHGEVADAYLTLVGYFNSLRELGGMRRLVEDEVRRLVMRRHERVPEGFEGESPWFAPRTIRAEPVELTSREKTSAIKDAKDRLELAHGKDRSVDVVLASNMISVGVDIDRLGLMVVAGQPKTTAEYIQASSRVGRNAAKPGLVVTCFNLSKPRDRSHYERFDAYHCSFYRFVEATSVTPFSAPALDRGLAGVVVGLSRLLDTGMTAPFDMMKVAAHRTAIEAQLENVVRRAGVGKKEEADRISAHVRQRITSLLDAWQVVINETKAAGGQRGYSKFDPESKKHAALLRQVLDEQGNATPDELKFQAPTSMRDVEPSVHLWLTKQPLGGYKQPKQATPETVEQEEVRHGEG
ncbi:MAG: helicase [Archangium gephyra]|uniref:Helicase n=1 Tax=Archangium gephyra TaxID=48 RepID=A0A2W5TM69_9BACT|nr:MAG: helicase [Archangium gephyra]